MSPTISKYKSDKFSLVREDILETSMNRYWSDKDFRLAINEKNKERARVRVCCVDCKKTMTHGSMRVHKKICKGFRELTPLEMLTNCLADLKM